MRLALLVAAVIGALLVRRRTRPTRDVRPATRDRHAPRPFALYVNPSRWYSTEDGGTYLGGPDWLDERTPVSEHQRAGRM